MTRGIRCVRHGWPAIPRENAHFRRRVSALARRRLLEAEELP